MEPKKITGHDLDAIFKKLHDGQESAIGNYLYKGLRIQISRYKSSGSERYMRLYLTRRRNGLCIRCGKKVSKQNPATGELYRLCEYHRKITDKKG